MMKTAVNMKEKLSVEDFLHYTLNTSDAGFLMKRDNEEAKIIYDWVQGWSNGYMVKKVLPLKLTNIIQSFEGLSILYTKCDNGWVFDIVFTDWSMPIAITANQVLISENINTKDLFDHTLLYGGQNKISPEDIVYPALLTSLNVKIMEEYVKVVDFEALGNLYMNYCTLEQCIAVALIEKGL